MMNFTKIITEKTQISLNHPHKMSNYVHNGDAYHAVCLIVSYHMPVNMDNNGLTIALSFDFYIACFYILIFHHHTFDQQLFPL